MADEIMDPWQRRFYNFAIRSLEVLQDIEQNYNRLIRQQMSDNDYAAVAESSRILKSIKYHIEKAQSPYFFSWNTTRNGHSYPSGIVTMYANIGYERAVKSTLELQYGILWDYWTHEIKKEARFYNRDFM